MFAHDLRQAAEAAPCARLDAVLSALYGAVAAGAVTEEEAAAIESVVHARRTASRASAALPRKPRTARRRPRPPEDLDRRRRLVAGGWMPPAIAALFTPGETAALAVVAGEIAARGSCALCHKQVADIAGVGLTTARNALRQARLNGLLRVRERRLSATRNDSNVVTLSSPEWESWLRMRTRNARKGGAVGKATRSNIQELTSSGTARSLAAGKGLPGKGGGSGGAGDTRGGAGRDPDGACRVLPFPARPKEAPRG